MTNEMNNLFDGLIKLTKAEIPSRSIMQYFYENFNMLHMLTAESITCDIAANVVSIYNHAIRNSSTDWDEILDAFLSVYPLLIKKIKEEIAIINIGTDSDADIKIKLIIDDITDKYNPSQYKFDNLMNE